MANVKVPSFLTGLDKQKKVEMIKEWEQMKESECIGFMKEYMERELDKLVLEDERSSYTTWFQTKWSKARRLGRREQLRNTIKDLTKSEE